jgi:predicted HTH domain antitoxin
LTIDTVRITIDLPRDIFSSLRQDPESFVREMRLAAAVQWYEARRISQGKAAEIAGLSRAEFIAALGQMGISPLQYTADEVIQEAQRE